MARGQQKIQAQQKNAERQAKLKKQQKGDSKKFAQAALKVTCAICRSQMPDPKTYSTGFLLRCIRERKVRHRRDWLFSLIALPFPIKTISPQNIRNCLCQPS